MKPILNISFIREQLFYTVLTCFVSAAIALPVAYQAYLSFDRLSIVFVLVFLFSFVLMETLFIVAMQLLSDVIDSVNHRRQRGQLSSEPVIVPTEQPEEPALPEPVEETPPAAVSEPAPEAVETAPDPIPTVEAISSEIPDAVYDERVRRFEQEKANEKTRLVNTLIEYVQHVMPSFIAQDDMPVLCEEIRQWAADPAYRPAVPVRIKAMLSSNDLRHFVWNIGERLGKDNGYSGDCRAEFCQLLFHEQLGRMDLASIKNFRLKPDQGPIPIDDPLPGRYDFAFQRKADRND